MASRSLGTLTLDLIARIGGWRSGLDQAARIADSKTREMEKTFGRLGGAVKGLFAGFSAGLVLHKFIEETSRAQKELAQLNAVIRSSGTSAGFSTDELIGFSKEIQRTTTYSDEAAVAAERMLIQFGKLGGAQFERALKLSADFAAASGQSLEEAALTVGRATSGAARGLLRLSVVGATFSKAQQKVIADLRATGKGAEANEIIFKELARATEGIAAASRSTLGGALAGLKNQFNDLFELDTSATGGIVSAINLLANNLELIAKVATRAAIAYGIFRAALVVSEITKASSAFFTLFSAVSNGTAVLIDATKTEQAGILAKHRAAVAATEVTAAEVARTTAIVAGNRATYQRIVADEASLASVATRATVTRNLAGSEAALAAATLAHVEATRKAGLQSDGARKAQEALTKSNSKLHGSLTLLLSPFSGIARFAAANPFTAIAAGVGIALVTLSAFADKIKLSKDGVVNLGNATTATGQLIAEAIRPYAIQKYEEVKLINEGIAKAFSKIKPAALAAAEGIGVLISFLPGSKQLKQAFDDIDKTLAKISERVRANEAKARADKEAAAAAARLAEEEEKAAVAQEEAVKKVKEMIATLTNQNNTLSKGAVEAIKYRIAHGDLKDTFTKLGPEAGKYEKALIALTAEHERLEAAAKKSKEAIQAKEQITDLIKDLETQIATYQKGEGALFEYRVAHGDLAKTLGLVGDAAEPLRQKLLALNEQIRAQKVADALVDIRVQLLELRGETEEAIKIKFEIEHRDLRTELRATNNQAGLEEVDRLEKAQIEQEKFNKLQEKAAEIRQRLADQEELIRNSQEVGAIGEIEAMRQIGDARAETLEQLREQLALMEAIAAASETPEDDKAVKELQVELEKLATQTDLVAMKINDSLKSAFENTFSDIVKGTKSVGEAFGDLVLNIRDMLLDLITQQLVQKLFEGLGGMIGNSGGLGGVIAGILGFEKGGYLPPGKMGIAGERGKAELIYGGRTGLTVLDHKKTMALVNTIKGSSLMSSDEKSSYSYPLPVTIGKKAIAATDALRYPALVAARNPIIVRPIMMPVMSDDYKKTTVVVNAVRPTVIMDATRSFALTGENRKFAKIADLLKRSHLLPTRDIGGRGYPGMPVSIGTGAQPEVFVPDAPGKFIPKRGLGEVRNYNQISVSIAAPNGTVSHATQLQTGAAIARALGAANGRNN